MRHIFLFIFSTLILISSSKANSSGFDCDEPIAYEVGTEENCTKECPNREINYEGSGTGINYVINCALKECPLDRPLRMSDGSCFSCHQPSLPSTYGDTTNCSVCPNRIEDDLGRCILKECPPDVPLRTFHGDCHPCDSNDLSAIYDAENCEACPNRTKVKFKYADGTGEGVECKLPEDPNLIKAIEGKCPTNKPLKNWDDICFSCNEEQIIAIDSECNSNKGLCDAICPNREIIYQVGGNPGSYLKCPADKPLRDENARCYSCNYEWGISMRFQPTNKCSRICPNRIQKSYICNLKKNI